MDYFTILAQRADLSEKIKGKAADTVKIAGNTLFIGFAGEFAVKLACIPDMPYLFWLEHRYIPQKSSKDWFASKIKDHIIADIEIAGNDRILTFVFDSGSKLVFEMTGRHANIILLDSGGIITGSLRTVTKNESSYREIIPGIPYISPPSKIFPGINIITPEYLLALFSEKDFGAAELLGSRIFPGSRFFPAETLAIAGIDPDKKTSELNTGEIENIHSSIIGLYREIAGGGFGGTVIYGMDSLPKDVFPAKILSLKDGTKFFDSLDDAVKTYAKERETGLELRSARTFVMASLKREEKSLRQTIKKILNEKTEKDEPDLLEKKGNILLAFMHLVKKGMSTIELPDIYGTGQIRIDLEPAVPLKTNIDRYFNRARKFREAEKHLTERLAMMTRRLELVTEELADTEKTENLAELKKKAAYHSRIISRGGDTEIDQQFPKRFKSPAGLEIVIGRNDKENDELLHWAKKSDYWFHAQGVAGSHVILRVDGKQPPDKKSIEQASAAAAANSKARTSAVVPVVYTLLKYVIKRKGQGPGQVTYTREKVLFVEPWMPGNG